MSTWKTMQEWKDRGPENGTSMILLLHNFQRVVGYFHGGAQQWRYPWDAPIEGTPVAWYDLEPIPMELIERQKRIEAIRADLVATEREPLKLEK